MQHKLNEDEKSRSDELTRENLKCVLTLEAEIRKRRTLMERVIDTITAFCGSSPFVYIHVLWLSGWISSDFVLRHHFFDPYPYQLLTLIVSLEAILLSAVILMSQNREAKIGDRRSHLGLQIELLAEQETTKMLKLLVQISKKLGIEPEEDPTTRILEEATDPKRLARQIDSALDEKK